MPDSPVTCIADSQCNLGEAPVWSAASGVLYWLDISISSNLFEWHFETRKTVRRPLNELATALALSDLDELIVVSEEGLSILERSTRRLKRLVRPPFSMQGMRFNDCGCDLAGRLWTGTMGNELRPQESSGTRIGELCRFDPDLTCQLMQEKVGCPNTFAWSQDNKTLYSADSATGSIYAYAFDLATGAIAERRIFAHPKLLGIPDGSAIDATGYLWNARWGAGCVVRFAPDGTVDQVVSVPADFVTSCTFGGPKLDTLFVTTARQHLAGTSIGKHQPFAGGVFVFKPKVPGTAESTFRISRSLRNRI